MLHPSPLPPELASEYSIHEEYIGGEGWTGAICDAQQQLFVLKILHPDHALEEPSLLVSLRHPCIPTVVATGTLADGRHYLIREHRPGATLPTPLPHAEVRQLAIQLLDILSYVHLRGILHHDIKPANILLTGADHIPEYTLLDFGLGGRTTARRDGGTLFFAAPERLLGLQADARADLFSLGVVLYCTLFGTPAGEQIRRFASRFPEENFFDAIDHAEVLAPPFDRFLPRLLHRNPSERYADAREALEALAGTSGRPAPSLLRPDPIAIHGPTIDAAIACLDTDHGLRLTGEDPDTRRDLALHAATRLGPRGLQIVSAKASVRLARRGECAHNLALPPLTPAMLEQHLQSALGLTLGQAQDTAHWLIESLEKRPTIAAVETKLLDFVRDGSIIADGTRWIWPDAVCGRLGRERPAPPSTPEALRQSAAGGRVAVAIAAYETQCRATEETANREWRIALATGLIEGGEPSRALPYTFDLPVHRARALLDLGQVAKAGNTLTSVEHIPSVDLGTDDNTRQRLIATLDHLRGDNVAAYARLTDRRKSQRTPESDVVLSQVLAKLGRHGEAISLLAELLGELEEAQQPLLVAAAQTSLAECQRATGNLKDAKRAYRHAQRVLHTLGHVRHSATAATNLGVVAKDLGHFKEALDQHRRARAMYEHVGDRRGVAIAEANLGLVNLAMGDAGTALPRLQRAANALADLGAQPLPDLQSKITAAQGLLSQATPKIAPDTMQPRDSSEAITQRQLLPAAQPQATVPREVFRTFLAVNRRLAGEANLPRAMEYLLDAAITLTGGRAGYLLLERENGLRQEFRTDRADTEARAFSRTMVNRAMQRGQILTGNDIIEDQGLTEMASVQNLRAHSAICAPFRTAAGDAGAIYIEHTRRADVFGNAEKEHLEILADQAAIAVGRMLYEEFLATNLAQSEKKLEVATRKARPRRQLLGKSRAMRELRGTIAKIAASELPVIVRGETGCGKELVAHSIHEQSPRHRGPFVAENCSAIPENLIESEFFGHVKGAFTGADQDRPGILEMASGGTLFLDEIGDMPMLLQVKLLRALQEGAVRPVGGEQLVPIDVRLVSATHKDLDALIAEAAFREDLYYRISGAELMVPPLRKRGRDVLLLAEAFLSEYDQKHGLEHQLGATAQEQLLDYDWPGNVRELHHVISRALILADTSVLDTLELPASRRTVSGPPTDWPAITLQEAEQRTIAAAMRETRGDKTKAARLLGISRTGLYEKLRRGQTRTPPGS